MAMATLSLLTDPKSCVPQDICFAGFHSFGFAAFAQPKLLTAQSPAHEIGRLIGVKLIKAI